MKALVWHGERTLSIDELPAPEPGADEVVLDVELAGICGSDLHGYRGHPGARVPPLVLGHEVVGLVEGRRYTVYPLVACGMCPRCLAGEDNLCASWKLIGMHRPGVFAEQVAVPRRSLVPLPAGHEPLRAVLAEPLACCVGALAPHALGEGSSLAVFGCGPLGLLSIHLGVRAGAHVVAVDPVAERLETACRLGAASAVSSAEELEPGKATIALDAAGFEATWRGAIDAVENGGTVVVLGLGNAEGRFPMAVVVRRAITVRGQFAYSRADFARAVEILAEGELELGWLSAAILDEGAEAFANLVDRPAEYLKVILSPV
ncbi:MAG TPA: alcohol dehydrogenase catalytic domain-containing protein [Gaiellaceae bacterium]|nr:alcohol dehydrogenase catalytic domain-containing protein [Gaiellaceae bacterium]